MGKRPTCGYFGPARILNLYRIAHRESTVDKWDLAVFPIFPSFADVLETVSIEI
jgi:hypothetical protein